MIGSRALRPADRGRRGQRALRARSAAASISSATLGRRSGRACRDPEIDVFVELIGGEGDPAKSAVEAALAAGKSVVTANKALLAEHGVRARRARRAAMAWRSISRRRSPAASRSSRRCARGSPATAIARIYGILNGTCNYILTRMEQERLSFAECLKDAQRLGYAEADPTFDIEGHDTAQKLAILASLAFGTEVDAERDLCRRHLLDHAGRSRMRPTSSAIASSCSASRCAPTRASSSACIRPWCRKDSAIAQVMGVTNAVTVDADAVARHHAGRPGRRRHGDRLGGGRRHRRYCARRARAARSAAPSSSLAAATKAPMQRHEGGYYIRLLGRRPARHRAPPSPSAWPSRRFRSKSIVQRHRDGPPRAATNPGRSGAPVPVILITYATTEDAVRKALQRCGATG